MDPSPTTIRPLGPCEIYSSSRHALGFYKCVINTCRYSVSLAALGSAPVRDVLKVAITNVVHATPSLNVGIAGEETSKPYFVQQPSVNIEQHFEFLEKPQTDPNARDSTLLEILQNQHDRRWPDIENRPPWKLTVVVWDPAPESGTLVLDAVFAVHHSIADGRSTALFHTKLLDQLNGHKLDTLGADKFVKPQEELVKFTTSWGFLFQTLWRELGPAWLGGQSLTAPWAGKPMTLEPCRTRLRLVTVSAVAVPHIISACRANQATLTPLIHTLALASLARLVPAEEAQTFMTSTPIDLRPFIQSDSQLESSKRPFGVFVTTHSHTFDESILTTFREVPSDDKIWKTASELRQSMKQHVDNVPQDDIMSMLGWVSDWKQFWLSKLGKPRQTAWEISNIGSIAGGHGPEGQATEGWKIQRSVMSQGASVAGAAIFISVAGVTEGDLSLALGWQEGIVDEQTVKGLAQDLQTGLDRLGRGERIVQL
ncbi:hypothetical protein N0V88_004487 [Collariella sp. IMI 366227]|nr:hypothetical protein N0V88_004487 [Collariella sp. IMI 366227]